MRDWVRELLAGLDVEIAIGLRALDRNDTAAARESFITLREAVEDGALNVKPITPLRPEQEEDRYED